MSGGDVLLIFHYMALCVSQRNKKKKKQYTRAKNKTGVVHVQFSGLPGIFSFVEVLRQNLFFIISSFNSLEVGTIRACVKEDMLPFSALSV